MYYQLSQIFLHLYHTLYYNTASSNLQMELSFRTPCPFQINSFLNIINYFNYIITILTISKRLLPIFNTFNKMINLSPQGFMTFNFRNESITIPIRSQKFAII